MQPRTKMQMATQLSLDHPVQKRRLGLATLGSDLGEYPTILGLLVMISLEKSLKG